jgi:hypothetical protein
LATVAVLCSAAAFTSVSPDDSAVDQSVINELRQAHRERAIAGAGLGDWAPDNLGVGDVAHEDDEWGAFGSGVSLQGMQTTLVAELVPQYVNYTINPSNTNAIVMFTVETWQEVSGLTNDGIFRRLTDIDEIGKAATNWLYGIAQEGDIVGHWLWADLQAGYTALKWTAPEVDGTRSNGLRYARKSGSSDDDCATALSDHQALWAGNTYGSFGAGDYASAARAEMVTNYGTPPDNTAFEGTRRPRCCTVRVPRVPAARSASRAASRSSATCTAAGAGAAPSCRARPNAA